MNVLFLSAHDFRTPRKAGRHFVAEKLTSLAKVRFFSIRYSWLSKRRPDPRHVIADRANRVETFQGVDCFLWRPPLHPFNLRRPYLRLLERWLYRLYVALVPDIFIQWVEEADVIFFESGIAPVFFEKIKKINPTAKLVYVAADELDAIDVASYVKQLMRRVSSEFDYVIVNSRAMVRDFSPGTKRFFVPHGIDESLREKGEPNPYSSGINAVSVGSMLFDSEFIRLAAASHPEMVFHVIGCGQPPHPAWPDNVRLYDEMPFDETIRYVKHADIGLAPYRPEGIPASLADTSLKLQQYAFFGIPAVCPYAAIGSHTERFGYQAGDVDSIREAITNAKTAGRQASIRVLNWQQVADRYMAPERYADTQCVSSSGEPEIVTPGGHASVVTSPHAS